MRHFVSPSFWKLYEKLPRHIQNLADKNFALLKENPRHPSLRLKTAGRYWSVRVGAKKPRLGGGNRGGTIMVLDWNSR